MPHPDVDRAPAASAAGLPQHGSEDLAVRIVEDADHLGRLRDAWDRLAVEAQRPACAPAWQLAWWRHLAPAGSRLRIVAVESARELVALGAFAACPGPLGRVDYRLLAAEMTHRGGLLPEAAAQPPVAEAVARALAQAEPRPSLVWLDNVDAATAWPRSLGDRWPGPRAPRMLAPKRQPAPVLETHGRTFDDWMASKSRNFRQQMRRAQRQLGDAGGAVRMTSSVADLERDVASFMRLHHARWEQIPGESALGGPVDRMLVDAGSELLPEGRFRLWLAEVEGRPISAQLFLEAGGRLMYWNGGFDPDWHRLKPALQTILAAVRHAFDERAACIDFGGGNHDYKLRFADGDQPLLTTGLVPVDRRYAVTRASLAPYQARNAARRAYHELPDPLRTRLGRFVGRGRPGAPA